MSRLCVGVCMYVCVCVARGGGGGGRGGRRSSCPWQWHFREGIVVLSFWNAFSPGF